MISGSWGSRYRFRRLCVFDGSPVEVFRSLVVIGAIVDGSDLVMVPVPLVMVGTGVSSYLRVPGNGWLLPNGCGQCSLVVNSWPGKMVRWLSLAKLSVGRPQTRPECLRRSLDQRGGLCTMYEMRATSARIGKAERSENESALASSS
jgi:hypothetical protein